MPNRRLHVSEAGKALINDVLIRRGWKRSTSEMRPVILASKYAMRSYAKANGWSDNEPSWIKDLFKLFNYYSVEDRRSERKRQEEDLKRELCKDESPSLVEKIEKEIESERLTWKEISPTQWKRFASQKNIHAPGFSQTAFEAFCAALELEAKDVAEEEIDEFSTRKIPSRLKNRKPTNCLLPNPECIDFVGRVDEQEIILAYLQPNSKIHHVSIHGLGGVGKTSLALEIAYRCREASQTVNHNLPSFNIFIYVSAKSERLTPEGKVNRLLREASFEDFLRKIYSDLQCGELIEGREYPRFLVDKIRQRLSLEPALLILDNLEVMDDIDRLLDFLQELPPTVKTISTTRESLRGERIKKVAIGQLTLEFGHQLISQRCKEEQIRINSKQIELLYQKTGGIPAAIGYAIGELAVGTPFEQVASDLVKSDGNYCQFYFEKTVNPLRNYPSSVVLMALALVPASSTFDTLVKVATVNEQSPTFKDFYALKKRSLIYQVQEDERENEPSENYDLISLTRQYALSDLEKHPELLAVLQENWINYYRTYVQEHGERDWRDWQQDYQGLKAEWENINAVVDLLIESNRYSDLCHMWKHIRCYTHVEWSGNNRLKYWNYRLNDLTHRLLELSEQRQDWQMSSKIILDRAWKLILMRQPQYLAEAESLLSQAREIQSNISSELQVQIATHTGILYLHQDRLDEAMTWLKKAQKLLDPFIKASNIQNSKIPFELKRQQVQIAYHKGEIYFYWQDYLKSKTFFEGAKRLCESMNWKRGIALTQNWIAEIAIELNDLGEAEELIEEGITIANANQDRCRLAYWLRTKARLQNKQRLAEATDTASEACKIFLELGMEAEAQEIEDDGLLDL